MRALTLLLLATVLAGCGGSESAAPPAATEAAAGTQTPSARVSGTTLDGNPISLDEYRGKPVLVNVWSSW